MARDRRAKTAAADRRRPQKKKVSILSTEGIEWIDYKDVNLLRRFMSERAKIRARRVTGNSAQQQRAVARAIRVAREMALLPYSVRQVTQRKGGRRDRDREPRDELRTPTPEDADAEAFAVEEADPATAELLESGSAPEREAASMPDGAGDGDAAADDVDLEGAREASE
jgi:small subunit ribosomal protein S18